MPSPKSSNRRGGPQPEEKNRRGKLTQKASSFHYTRPNLTDATSSYSSQSFPQLLRPKTLPDLVPNRGIPFDTTSFMAERQQAMKLTKILMNVTIQGSIGAVHVLISPDSTVGDLITAALSQYGKEARRPIFPTADPAMFNLHYSQFTLECLHREEKLMELGSRNFFLCPKNIIATGNIGTTSSCATQADKIVAKSAFGWLKFINHIPSSSLPRHPPPPFGVRARASSSSYSKTKPKPKLSLDSIPSNLVGTDPKLSEGAISPILSAAANLSFQIHRNFVAVTAIYCRGFSIPYSPA